MRSVTEQAALDEFLSTAELAGTDFTAEKMNNVKIIHTDQRNPYLLSSAEERAAVGKQKAHTDKLTVPRRPKWDATTTPEQLDRMERDGLLDWRRGLAELQENNDLLMTPFERNLEVWRQLWRVIERSDLVVQIVDARNPLLFRSQDLESYVTDINPQKRNLLLVNKADLLTPMQRKAWADYFQKEGIAYKFFSASIAREINELRNLEDEVPSDGDDTEEEVEGEAGESRTSDIEPQVRQMRIGSSTGETEETGAASDADEDGDEEEDEDEGTRILTVEELEDLFLEHAPKQRGRQNLSAHSSMLTQFPENDDGTLVKTQIGLVGYPNVGKSSTINALIGAKKVSVSSTPGKTKHFQTIHLSDKVLLCDCPGLVFPNFASTKADLVCNGILPIDQLREFTGPAGLVAQRIPQAFIEAVYGIKIATRPVEEGGTGVPTAEELLRAYAKARGFTRTGQGQPDESRAARYILKDLVNGKLLYCQPPPTIDDAMEFNKDLYDIEHLPEKRRLALEADGQHLDDVTSVAESQAAVPEQGAKAKKLDKAFFQNQGSSGHMKMPFSHKYSIQGTASGKQLSGRKQKTLLALEKDVDPSDTKLLTSKKHFKAGKTGNGKRRADYFAD